MKIPFFLFLVLTSAAFAADSYRIVHTYPHDPQAFTQGLVFVDGHLYESTGLNGRSSLRMDDLETGRVLQSQRRPDTKYFAEGLTDWGSTLIQLTWQSHIAFVYDRFSFRLLRTLPTAAKAGDSPRTARTSSSATAPQPSASSIPQPSTRSATSSSRNTASRSPISTSSSSSTARSTPTSGTPIASPASRPQPARSSAGSISPACWPENERTDPEAVLNGIA